jgi:hypothetical protein
MAKTYREFLMLKEESEGSSYQVKLQEIADNAKEISSMISDEDELESWIQDKITIAHHNMTAILSYYKSSKEEDESDGDDSMTDLPKEDGE